MSGEATVTLDLTKYTPEIVLKMVAGARETLDEAQKKYDTLRAEAEMILLKKVQADDLHGMKGWLVSNIVDPVSNARYAVIKIDMESYVHGVSKGIMIGDEVKIVEVPR